MLYQQTRALDPGFLNVIIGFNFKFSFSGQSSHICIKYFAVVPETNYV